MLRFRLILLLLAVVSVTWAQGRFSPAQWRQDIDSLQRQLPAVHPNFFATYPRKNFEQDLQNLKATLTGKSDFQIGLELQTIVARAGDAQTRLDLTNLMMGEKVIPFALSVWAGELHVSATIQQFAQMSGARILRVNGLSAPEALAKMGRFVAQENEYTNQRDALTLFRFPAALRMAGVSTTDTLALLVEKKDGQQALVRAYPLDPSKPPSRADTGPVVIEPLKPDLRWQQVASFFNLQWLPADSVLYVPYNYCYSQEMSLAIGDTASAGNYPSFQVFADSLFTFLAKTPPAKVLIDLRFNPGGDAADGVAWARRFAALPQAQRPAQLYVAINLFTQNAALEVAAALTSVGGATLIGEPSATRPNHFAGIRQLSLPNTQLPVLFATQYRAVQKGNSTVLTPRILIPVTFEHYRNGRDPVLDFVRGK